MALHKHKPKTSHGSHRSKKKKKPDIIGEDLRKIMGEENKKSRLEKIRSSTNKAEAEALRRIHKLRKGRSPTKDTIKRFLVRPEDLEKER